jgi:hypothetical protein
MELSFVAFRAAKNVDRCATWFSHRNSPGSPDQLSQSLRALFRPSQFSARPISATPRTRYKAIRYSQSPRCPSRVRQVSALRANGGSQGAASSTVCSTYSRHQRGFLANHALAVTTSSTLPVPHKAELLALPASRLCFPRVKQAVLNGLRTAVASYAASLACNHRCAPRSCRFAKAACSADAAAAGCECFLQCRSHVHSPFYLSSLTVPGSSCAC